MGAWGTGVFESDTALDFADDLTETGDLARVDEALQDVLGEHDAGYLDADVAEAGLVAAEVIAALRGHPGDLPDGLRAWIAARGPASGEMVALAQRAVQRILAANSELRELWEESDDFAAWRAVIDDLSRRLAA